MADAPVVLVVEDEPLVQQTLCTALTLMGFQTRRADNVDAALTVLANERIGLSVLAHVRSKMQSLCGVIVRGCSTNRSGIPW